MRNLKRRTATPVLSETTDRFIDKHEVRDLSGFSDREIDRRAADGRFPKPYHLGPNTKRWSLREIEKWQHAVRSGAVVKPNNPRRKPRQRIDDARDDATARTGAPSPGASPECPQADAERQEASRKRRSDSARVST
jgi:predicted DNA-binding transcriptional regulator AlpA